MNNRISPRQKMINLMYVVLMAMLALNVSSDVLNCFSTLGEAIHRISDETDINNNNCYNRIVTLDSLNHEKTGMWKDYALQIKYSADSIWKYIENVKKDIAVFADGEHADIYNLIHKDDMEVAHRILLDPISKRGQILRQSLEDYRKQIEQLPIDSVTKDVAAVVLSLQVPSLTASWQEYWFANATSTAAIAVLTKLQGDVRYTEGVVMNTLYNHIGKNDFRVNELGAFVIPEATTILAGNNFKAKICMAAVDSTAKPKVFIDGGKKIALTDNTITIPCNSIGDFTLNGHLEVTDNQGNVVEKNFSQPYKVIKPFATVAADMMNMLYAGYENPISVSVPGIAAENLDIQISGGSLVKNEPGRYIVTPSDNKEVIVTISANNHVITKVPFRVRPLPQPSAYMEISNRKGDTRRFKGGVINRNELISTAKLKAAIDDGLMDIAFKVQDFEVVSFDGIGNAVPFRSNGDAFSAQQLQLFRTIARNKRCYISRIRTVGPDGTERILNTSMEIIIR